MSDKINMNDEKPVFNYGSMGSVPAGKYNVVMVDAETTTSKTDNVYTRATFEITEGRYANYEITCNYNLQHEKPKVRAIAKRQLIGVMHAIAANLSPNDKKKIQEISPDDFSPLYFKPLSVTVDAQSYVSTNPEDLDENGDPKKRIRNNVKKVGPYDPTLNAEEEEEEEEELEDEEAEEEDEEEGEEEEADEEDEKEEEPAPKPKRRSKKKTSKKASSDGPDWQ